MHVDPPPPDPNLIAQQAQAERDQIAALKVQAQGDTASLMARYGTRLALGGATGGSPLTMPATNFPYLFQGAVGAMAGR